MQDWYIQTLFIDGLFSEICVFSALFTPGLCHLCPFYPCLKEPDRVILPVEWEIWVGRTYRIRTASAKGSLKCWLLGLMWESTIPFWWFQMTGFLPQDTSLLVFYRQHHNMINRLSHLFPFMSQQFSGSNCSNGKVIPEKAFSCFAVIHVCLIWEKISTMKPASSVDHQLRGRGRSMRRIHIFLQ